MIFKFCERISWAYLIGALIKAKFQPNYLSCSNHRLSFSFQNSNSVLLKICVCHRQKSNYLSCSNHRLSFSLQNPYSVLLKICVCEDMCEDMCVSSAKGLGFGTESSDKSFTYIFHATRIQTRTAYTKIPCQMHDAAWGWCIAKKCKIFWSYFKHFWILLVGLCK